MYTQLDKGEYPGTNNAKALRNSETKTTTTFLCLPRLVSMQGELFVFRNIPKENCLTFYVYTSGQYYVVLFHKALVSPIYK